jgi:hypothetical protein
MRRLRKPLTYANVMSSIAVFVVLGGGAYAATTLPRNSVASKQIKANAVTSSKVKDGSLLSKDFKPGQLVAGAAGPAGPTGAAGPAGKDGAKGDKGDPGTNGTNGTNGATEIVTRWTDTAITANTDVYGSASCNAGEKITGGGFGITGVAFNNSFTIRSGLTYTDQQAAAPQGTWLAGVRSANVGTLRVWAICASP